MRQVRNVEQKFTQRLLNVGELRLQAYKPVAEAARFREQRRRIVAAPFGDADLLRQRVATRLQILRARLNRLALALERFEPLDVECHAAMREARRDAREIGSQKVDV